MPTISIFHRDFESLIGRTSTIDQIEAWLTLVKGELKDHTPDTGEIRVELQDSNRPDLWCVEGIARQIRIKLQEAPASCNLMALGLHDIRDLFSVDLEKVRTMRGRF